MSNKVYRSSVYMSKSGQTRFAESWTDENRDSCDSGTLNGSNRATIGDPGGTTAAAPCDADTATSVSIVSNS